VDDLRSRLIEAVGPSVVVCPLDAVRAHLGPDREGVVVLAAARLEDAQPIRELVREASLRQWPLTVMTAVAGDGALDQELARLDPYVAGRFLWPEEAPALENRVRQGLSRGRNAPIARDDLLEGLIARRLLSQTPSLRPLINRLAVASRYDVTVLLTGEPGTGKTFLARLLHECSDRKEQGFLVVPCGALVANLIESEFFGHVRGAFSGADRARVGKFEAAGTGTILLDEIDALALDQQAKLLRVIETGEFEPVGSNDTRICHARIIAGSNWDLEGAVRQGKFREDLYYRLNVMSFHLPPLRERVQDIAPLVRDMVARFSQRFRKDLFAVSAEALECL
jgi:DNA-binding NtrC family response regulator